MADNRTEAEVLLETFTSFHGNRIADALVAVAAKVRELDAPGHAKAAMAQYELGLLTGLASPAKPPQPPKPKTADQFSPETHAIYDALKAAGHLTGLATCEIAAQAAHEFLSKPKVMAGELLVAALRAHGKLMELPDMAEIAETFFTLAREHGLLEAGE